MKMESSLAMPPRLRTPSHAEFKPNRPHSSYAIAFGFTLMPGLGFPAGQFQEISIFPGEPTKRVARVAPVARFRSVGCGRVSGQLGNFSAAREGRCEYCCLMDGECDAPTKKAVPKLGNKGSRPAGTFQERLETLLSRHRAKAEHTDQKLMQVLAHETTKMAEIVEGIELRDAALIASAQKLEHYEIAAYGTAERWRVNSISGTTKKRCIKRLRIKNRLTRCSRSSPKAR